jgi:hypothetical protein
VTFRDDQHFYDTHPRRRHSAHIAVALGHVVTGLGTLAFDVSGV